MNQVVQLAGALAILAAYIAAQVRLVDQASFAYLVPNLVGAGALAVVAWVAHQWGFVLLEVVWTLVTAWSLVARIRGPRAG